jgi:hypothetical protein
VEEAVDDEEDTAAVDDEGEFFARQHASNRPTVTSTTLDFSLKTCAFNAQGIVGLIMEVQADAEVIATLDNEDSAEDEDAAEVMQPPWTLPHLPFSD